MRRSIEFMLNFCDVYEAMVLKKSESSLKAKIQESFKNFYFLFLMYVFKSLSTCEIKCT